MFVRLYDANGNVLCDLTGQTFTLTTGFVINTFRLSPDYAAKRAKDQAAPWWRRWLG